MCYLSEIHFTLKEKTMANPVNRSLPNLKYLVLPGSIDGMCGASAFLRFAAKKGEDTNNITLIFAQAHEVGRIDPQKWEENSFVGFIDLPVNNDTKSNDPQQLTVDLVNKIKSRGCEILVVADEHGKKQWEAVFAKCGLDIQNLLIPPQDRTQEEYSSSAILKKSIDDGSDKFITELLYAGDQGDRMNFNTPIGNIMNRATKSNIGDNTRREYLVRHLATNETSDPKIDGWIGEYDVMEANLPKIMETGEDLGNGIFRYDAQGLSHDATEFFKSAYSREPKPVAVVLKGTSVFRDGKVQPSISVGTDRKDLNVLQALQNAGIKANGFPLKGNAAIEDEEAAINAVRQKIVTDSLK
jgi:hypothetical protein